MAKEDPIMTAWEKYDRSTPGWGEAKPAIDAYLAGDLETAIWLAQRVHDRYGHIWMDLSAPLRA